MQDLNIEELKQLLSFYRQRSSEFEFENLQWQLKYNRLLNSQSQPIPATKITKTKSE